MASRLGRRFYRRDPETLAKALLGQVLVRRLEDGTTLAGRIVEVEAYLGIPDRAAHSFGGRLTRRNASMWRDGGHAYVYFTYGMHWCFNVVADREGVPTACLIRALEPLEGLEEMRRRRGKSRAFRVTDTDLCSGPAKLSQALGLDRAQDGMDLVTSDALHILRGWRASSELIEASARIGVGYSGEWARKQLRFFLRGNPNVSKALR